MRQITHITSLTLGAVLLTACAATGGETIDPALGDAVRQNIAAQTLHPEAAEAPIAPSPLDGQTAEALVERYRTDTGEADDETLIEDIGGN